MNFSLENLKEGKLLLISGKKGRVNKAQRTRWLMCLPISSAVNEAMQSFSRTTFSTSLQNQEMSASSISKDNTDSQKKFEFLEQNNSFECTDNDLRSITSGIVAIDELLMSIKQRKPERKF